MRIRLGLKAPGRELRHETLALPDFTNSIWMLLFDLRDGIVVGLGVKPLGAIKVTGAVQAIVAVIFWGHGSLLHSGSSPFVSRSPTR